MQHLVHLLNSQVKTNQCAQHVTLNAFCSAVLKDIKTFSWGGQALWGPETGHAQELFTCPASAEQHVIRKENLAWKLRELMACAVLAQSTKLWRTGTCHHLCESWTDFSCFGRSVPDFGETLKSWLAWILIWCSSWGVKSASSAQCSMSIFWSEGNKKALGNQSAGHQQGYATSPGL